MICAWFASAESELAPVDFQLVFDFLDTVNAADKLLRHLLLIESSDDTLQPDMSGCNFDVYFAR